MKPDGFARSVTFGTLTADRLVTFPADHSGTVAELDVAQTFTATQAFAAVTGTTFNGNTLTTGSSTYTGTAGQTYTFPTTTASIARTDAGQTFTGINTFGNTTITSANAISWSARGILSSPAAGQIQLGTTDVNGTPVNQTLSAQSAITGSNLAGASLTLLSGRGTGSGASGSIILQTAPGIAGATTQNTYITGFTLDSVQHVTLGGGAPTAGTGTTSIGANATDQRFTLTTSTSVTTFAVSFARTWVNRPVCVATEESATPIAIGISAISTSAVTFSAASALTSTVIDVLCQ